MNLDHLRNLALSPSEYVGVDAADLRRLFAANPSHPQSACWQAANGAKVGMVRIARATLRQLLGMPLEDTPTDPYPSTAIGITAE